MPSISPCAVVYSRNFLHHSEDLFQENLLLITARQFTRLISDLLETSFHTLLHDVVYTNKAVTSTDELLAV